MSNSWIKGPRCGVDNCRSRFYRSVDGRRICQYGHVNEGHIDFNDDDDDNFIVTKRLNIPTITTGLSQASQITPGLHKDESKRKLYGVAGRELFFKSFQCVLKSQIKTLINDHGLPEILETVVKGYYVQYLTVGTDFSIVGEEDDDDADEEQDEEDQEKDDDDGNIDDDDEGFNTQDTMFTNDTSNEDREFQFSKLPTHLDSLALCYLGCRYLNLPIYINDFIQWTTTNRIPYMRASFNIPKVLRDRLSMGKLRLFEPRRPPSKGDLCFSISKVAIQLKITHLELNYEPLLFKAIKELILSPQIYYATKSFIDSKKIKLAIIPFKDIRTLHAAPINEFPEVKLISIIISVTKLYFINGIINKDHSPYDWKKWKQLLENLDLEQDENRNFHNVLTSLLLSKDSGLEIIDWDEKKTNKYLDWFTQKIVNTQATEEGPPALKRLFDIFELPKEDDQEKEREEDVEKENANTIENAYQQLRENCSAGDKLADEDLMEIEKLLVENLVANFGLTVSQLTSAVRHNEYKHFLK